MVQVQDAADQDAEDDESAEEVVVTGSRLRKDSFNSPSPLQVFKIEDARKVGVSTIQELLTRSTVANGTQIDQSLNNNAGNSNATEAPPEGGVGSSNINLRNLGAARSLVLVNGRRLAATGVRGAPSQPDLGLIPLALVDRVEVLTEGASSIYGADAVAGVVNVTLRSEFEGLEVSGNFEQPLDPGGDVYQVSFLAGSSGERARILVGGEWFQRSRVQTNKRDFSSSLREITVAPDGSIRQLPRSGFFDNVIIASPGVAVPFPNPFTGAPITATQFFFTPGATDIGIPNFSTGFALPVPQPPLFDPAIPAPPGSQNTRFPLVPFYNDQTERGLADLVGDARRISVIANGSVDLNFWNNEQFYFESYYLNRRTFSIASTEQIFPDVPGQIDQLDANGVVIGRVDNPLNPFPVDIAPILTLEDVPQTRNVELEQFRFVAGFRGDFAGGFLGEKGWNWDTYFSFDRGIGFQSQPILFEPNLTLATLNVRQLADGSLSCDIPNNTDQNGAFVTPQTCIPINFANPDLYTGGRTGEGIFTDAERDFLVGTRTNRTAIEQFVVNGFFGGELFTSPWGGAITAGFGGEYRRDVIRSQNSTDGVFGTNAAEAPSVEGDTNGARRFYEFFGEVDIPLIREKPWIDLLQIDGAVRYTNESNFGDDVTYRARALYRPVNWLQFSGAYGTSFRAPNLREQFLADQGGASAGTLDPCIAVNITNALTSAGSDTEAQFANRVQNCIASGVLFTDTSGNGVPDATVLGSQGVTSISTISGGNSELLPETSRSFTVSGSFTQPWFKSFDFVLAASYYNIRIRDTVAEPDASLIVANCFLDTDFPSLSSPFCSLISRPGTGATSNIINEIDVSFFNIGEETAKGVDVNTRLTFDLPFKLAGSPIAFTHTTTSSYQLEQERETFDPSDRDDNVGEIGSPRFRFNNVANFRWGEFDVTVENRRLGAQDNDGSLAAPVRFLDQLVSPTGAARPVAEIGTIVDFVDPVWYHDVSVTWSRNNFSLTAGVNNIANRAPPLIDSTRGFQRNNAVTSAGYDLFGRTLFLNGSIRF